MMENMFDTELSLFPRDLLVADATPSAAELIVGQDGCKSVHETSASSAGLSYIFNQDDVVLGDQDDASDEAWLEKNLNLLQYLIGADLDEVIETNNADEQIEQFVSQARAVEILKNAAEETSLQLSFTPDSPGALNQTSDETSEQIQLLDLLAQNFDDSNLAILDSPILSPMSGDEVDSILSSGPDSPLSDSVDFSGGDEVPAPDVLASVDLTQLLTQVQYSESPTSESQNYTSDSVLLSSPYQAELPPPISDRQKIVSLTPVSQRAKPYSRPGNTGNTRARSDVERKMRKKQQNKDAATRYREKKRLESTEVHSEVDDLEKINKDLRDRVEQTTREISFIKNLLIDIYKEKGILQ